MDKEREDMTYLELLNDIIVQAEELEVVDDLADAIQASDTIKDAQLRLVVVDALVRRIIELSKCSTSIWLDANELRKREKKAETSAKTPEQELSELEEDTEDDLPFC